MKNLFGEIVNSEWYLVNGKQRSKEVRSREVKIRSSGAIHRIVAVPFMAQCTLYVKKKENNYYESNNQKRL